MVYHKNNCSGLCFDMCFNHFGKITEISKGSISYYFYKNNFVTYSFQNFAFFFFEIHLSGAIIASSHLFLLSSVVGRWIFLFNYDKIHFKSAKEVWKTKTILQTNPNSAVSLLKKVRTLNRPCRLIVPFHSCHSSLDSWKTGRMMFFDNFK